MPKQSFRDSKESGETSWTKQDFEKLKQNLIKLVNEWRKDRK